MTSQPGLQTTAIRILPNILQGKGNQTRKFGQLIEYYKTEIFFLKNVTANEARRQFPDLLFFKKD